MKTIDNRLRYICPFCNAVGMTVQSHKRTNSKNLREYFFWKKCANRYDQKTLAHAAICKPFKQFLEENIHCTPWRVTRASKH